MRLQLARVFGFVLALGLGTALRAPMPAGAQVTPHYSTKITIRNDTPNPAYVLFDFLVIPNHKDFGWADANGGTVPAARSTFLPFLTHVHVYIKPEGERSESAPTICYVGASYANNGYLSTGGFGHYQLSLHYDARHNTCWLDNV